MAKFGDRLRRAFPPHRSRSASQGWQAFRHRMEAGQLLAQRLQVYANQKDVLVLALPRGGVPVAFEVANALNAPLDLCLVRKLGVPGYRELAMGAIAYGGVRVLNTDVINSLGIDSQTIEAVTSQELEELQRRDRVYRGDRPPIDVKNKTIILIDDGIATGSTMRAAITILRQQHPAKIVVGIPVAPPKTYEHLQLEVDDIVCLLMPESMSAIGYWYEDFTQTTDEEVCSLLAQNWG